MAAVSGLDIVPSPCPVEVPGVRSGRHCVPISLRPKTGAHDAVRPYRVERPVATVASQLGVSAIEHLTAAYLHAPDVAASYFLFLRDVAYVVDFGVVGMTLRATSVAQGVLRDGGCLPPTGMPQYGAVSRRLIIQRPLLGSIAQPDGSEVTALSCNLVAGLGIFRRPGGMRSRYASEVW